MTSNKRMLTLRVQVTITFGGKRPQRVRVVAKNRGALLFPYCRKLASIPLYKADWKRLPGNLWRNEQAMAVPVDVAKMLKYRNLALQLYCLRGTDVKHKGVFNFRRVMAQQQLDDEVFLAMHYSATCWWHCLAFGCCCKAAEDEAVPVVVRGGGEERARGAGEGLGDVWRGVPVLGTPALPQASPLGLGAGDDGLADMWRGVPTPGTPALSQASPLASGAREDSLGDVWRGVPTSGTPALSQASPLARVSALAADVPAASTMEHLEEPTSPRPMRFPDSGAVIPELLRQHDLLAAEVRTRLQAEEAREDAPLERCPRRHRWLARGVLAAVVAVGTLLAGQDAPLVHWLLCGSAAALLLVYACAHARV